MSSWREYIKLIPSGIKDADKIVKGIYNSIMLENIPTENRDEILKRRVTCEGCPFMSANAKTSEEFLALTGQHYKTERFDKHCTFCGCPLGIRTAALDKNCGIEDWNEDNPDVQLELKWTKHEQSS